MTKSHHSVSEETIHLYLDGELSPSEREVFTLHLEQCSSCQARLAELQSLITELASLEEIQPPIDVVSAVMAKLPARAAATTSDVFGQVAILTQIIIGVILIMVAWPVINSAINSVLVWQAWFTFTDMALSLNNWLTDSIVNLNIGIAALWPPSIKPAGFNIGPGLVTVLIAGLSLAWLVGNGVLLRHIPPSPKNGGTL